jgi:hypothetical protein
MAIDSDTCDINTGPLITTAVAAAAATAVSAATSNLSSLNDESENEAIANVAAPAIPPSQLVCRHVRRECCSSRREGSEVN